MRNKDIKYELSTDYERLYQLLKGGNILVGHVAIDDYEGGVNREHSKPTSLLYNETDKFFNLGFIFFESDFNKIDFIKLCNEM